MRKYFVGANLALQRAATVQFAESILTQLQGDKLPGVTDKDVAELRRRLDAYIAEAESQGSRRQAVSQERERIRTELKTITDERIAIQFAVDAAFPPGNPASAPARAAFGLPIGRPFRVR